KNFKEGATLHLESTDETLAPDDDDATEDPDDTFFVHESELRATFSEDISGDWTVVVTNPDGQSDESDPFTITREDIGEGVQRTTIRRRPRRSSKKATKKSRKKGTKKSKK